MQTQAGSAVGRAGALRRVAGRCAKVALALLVASAAWFGIGAAARDAFAAVAIRTVGDDAFAPDGYGWRFEFESVTSASGFERVSDLAPYYSAVNHSDPSTGFYDCVKKGDSGYAAFIDAATTPLLSDGSPRFALRFSGGTYEGRSIDAVLSLTDWTYIEADVGWENYWIRTNPDTAFEQFRTGVYYNEGYTNDSRYRALNEQPSLSNINLYLVGLADVSIELQFYEAGTDVPVAVKGHATSIDLDGWQGMTFHGGIDVVEVAERSLEASPSGEPFLTIDAARSRVTAGSYVVSATDADGYYLCALVGSYFSTDANTPYAITFHSPWSGSNNFEDGSASTAMSFFALTPEYVANPSEDEMAQVEKAVDASGPVSVGERFTYSISVTVPVEGLTCRVGYRYQALAIVDELDSHVRAVSDGARLRDNGEVASSAGTFFYDSATNTVRFDFDESFLAGEQLQGQTFVLEFDAYAASYPQADSEGRYRVPNAAEVVVNNAATLETNTVYVELQQGAVRIVKSDESGGRLSGARFSITQEDGTPVREGVAVDDSGEAVVTGLPLGSYLITEIEAPVGYAPAAQSVPFSVTESNAGSTQVITVVNELDKKTVTAVKRIAADDVYWEHGEPAFLMTLEGTASNGKRYAFRKLAEFREDAQAASDGYLYATVVFEDVPVGDYVLAEGASVRYELESIESNGTVTGSTVSFDLLELDEGTATFTNRKVSDYGGSDETSVINWFEAG